MKFDLDEALKIANQAVHQIINRNLTDVEIIVFKGAWERDEYDAIAAKNQYATSYISQDVAPKLWKFLSEALEEKVKKSNFKEALKRRWQIQLDSTEKSLVANNFNKSQRQYLGNSQQLRNKNKEKNTNKNLTELYVERPPIESICLQTLLQPGALVRIKAPSLMGKTSLITKLFCQLAEKKYYTVNLSLELADRNTHLTNLNKFLR